MSCRRYGTHGLCLILASLSVACVQHHAIRQPSDVASLPPVKAAEVGLSPIYIPETTNLPLGVGVQTLSGAVRTSCVDPKPDSGLTLFKVRVTPANLPQGGLPPVPIVGANHDTIAQALTFTLREVESLRSLREQMSLSAAASFNYGIYSGSANYTQLSSHEENSYYLYVLVMSHVARRAQGHTRWGLTADAKKALKKGRLDFYTLCGDHFVTSQTDGGAFDAILTIETSSYDDAQAASVEVKAGIGAFNASGSMSSATQKSARIRNATVFVLDKGPALTSGVPITAESAVAVATNYPKAVAALPPGAAWPITAELTDYGTVPGVKPSDVPDTHGQWTFLQQLGALMDSVRTYEGDLKLVQTHPTQFVLPPGHALAPLQDSATQAELEIGNAANACLHDPFNRCEIREWPHIPRTHFAFKAAPAVWVSLTPGLNPPYEYCFHDVEANVIRRGVVELTGAWSRGRGWPYESVTNTMQVYFANTLPGGGQLGDRKLWTGAPIPLPDNSSNYQVCTHTIDNDPYYDNTPDPTNPPLARVTFQQSP